MKQFPRILGPSIHSLAIAIIDHEVKEFHCGGFVYSAIVTDLSTDSTHPRTYKIRGQIKRGRTSASMPFSAIWYDNHYDITIDDGSTSHTETMPCAS